MLKQHRPYTTQPQTTHTPLPPKSRLTARQRGYNTRWEKARKRYLSQHPVCVQCEADGRPKSANEVDHIIPHRGDQKLFWDEDNWQSLCKPHHSKKTIEERKQWQELWLPVVSKPTIPVELVCGAPGSGKTTYCRNNAWPNNLVIDLDDIKREIKPGPFHLHRAVVRRNQIIESLSQLNKYDKAFLIVGAPKHYERLHWVEQLGCTVTVIDTDQGICIDRIVSRDGDRAVVSAVSKWYKDYVAGHGERVIRCT